MMQHRGWACVVAACLVCAVDSRAQHPSWGANRNTDATAGWASNQKCEMTEAAEIAGLKQGAFKANILLTDSHSAIEKWVLLPAAERSRAGRIREVTPGKKIYVPFVVTDYAFPASERMNLSGHVRLVSPDGRTLFDRPRFSTTIGADPRSPSVIVLNPVMDITFDSDDLPGTYTIRVIITDQVHSACAKAEESLQLTDPEALPALRRK